MCVGCEGQGNNAAFDAEDDLHLVPDDTLDVVSHLAGRDRGVLPLPTDRGNQEGIRLHSALPVLYDDGEDSL